nr:MAG TPA: hypothetical protein [Bacteriophage sp.]
MYTNITYDLSRVNQLLDNGLVLDIENDFSNFNE